MSHLDDSSLCVNKLRRMFIFTPLNMENIQLEQWTFALKLVILERREMGDKTAPHGRLPPEGPNCAAEWDGDPQREGMGNCPTWGLPPGFPWSARVGRPHISQVHPENKTQRVLGKSWKCQVKAAVPLPKASHTPLQKNLATFVWKITLLQTTTACISIWKCLQKPCSPKSQFQHITSLAKLSSGWPCCTSHDGTGSSSLHKYYFELPVIAVILNTTGVGSRAKRRGCFHYPSKLHGLHLLQLQACSNTEAFIIIS